MVTAGKCQKWVAAATEEDKHEINQSEIDREVQGTYNVPTGENSEMRCAVELFVCCVCLFVCLFD